MKQTNDNISVITGEPVGVPLNRTVLAYHLPGRSRIVRISKKNMTRMMRVMNPAVSRSQPRRRQGQLARA